MITLLKEILSSKDIFAYNIKKKTTTSYELYFIKHTLDMNRKVDVCEYEVSVFIKDNNKLGKCCFSVEPSMDKNKIDKLIDSKIKYANLSKTSIYNLPSKKEIKPNDKEISFDNKSLKEAAFIIADNLFEQDTFKDGYLNSSEIFVSFIKDEYFDSANNYYINTTQQAFVEIVATFASNGFEVEQYKSFELATIDEKYIKEMALNLLTNASIRLKATALKDNEKYKLLLTDDYAKCYFETFTKCLNVVNVYNKESNFKIGDSLNEQLTITMLPTLPNSSCNFLFDDEGVYCKTTKIIEKGKVINYFGSSKESQYLNSKIVGKMKNFKVSEGLLTDEDLDNENYIEILSFSDFDIDNVTGDFLAEIRLALVHNKKDEDYYITGGSVSGNIFDINSKATYYNKLIQINNYIGPKKVLLDNVVFQNG